MPATITFSDNDIQPAPKPPSTITFSDSDVQDAPKPTPSTIQFSDRDIQQPRAASPTPAAPSVWDRVSRVITESPLAHSLGSFFDPNEIRSEWQSAGPELRKNPAFALR